jgi:hypothetical protein
MRSVYHAAHKVAAGKKEPPRHRGRENMRSEMQLASPHLSWPEEPHLSWTL